MHKGVCQAAPFWSGQSSDKKSQGRGEASERKWQCKNGRMELADGNFGDGGWVRPSGWADAVPSLLSNTAVHMNAEHDRIIALHSDGTLSVCAPPDLFIDGVEPGVDGLAGTIHPTESSRARQRHSRNLFSSTWFDAFRPLPQRRCLRIDPLIIVCAACTSSALACREPAWVMLTRCCLSPALDSRGTSPM